jgi:ATP-dependent DNA helicase RecG
MEVDKSSVENLHVLLNADKENEHIEFKLAESSFSFEAGRKSVCGYSVALANEGGGRLILGVTDKKPRKVVGTKAFINTSKLEQDLYKKLKRRITVSEIYIDGKRVLIINVPSRPIGEALEFDGQYLMRVGDELLPMSPDKLKAINNEAVGDFSSKILSNVSYDDLSSEAIDELRKLLSKSNRVEKDLAKNSDKQMLQDLGLIESEKITIAALVLLGNSYSLKKFIPNAEIRYGYKSNEKEIRNQESVIYTDGYLLFYNRLWDKIDSRNLALLIPQGLSAIEKKVFDEETIREAINNAIIHRDYSEHEPIIIIQSPYNLNITSPGGLPPGITIENIATTTKTRNKLIADVLYKCEFVEQFGNGVNLMIKNQLSLGKNPPNYFKTDKYRVILDLDGNIKDIEFAKYVLKVANKLKIYLNDAELMLLYDIKEGKRIQNDPILKELSNVGIIERINANKYILSKQYYASVNQKGVYTRRRGLDKETNKELIIKHLQHYKRGVIKEFQDALKDVPKSTLNSYLAELKKDGVIELVGNPSSWSGPNKAYWQLVKK